MTAQYQVYKKERIYLGIMTAFSLVLFSSFIYYSQMSLTEVGFSVFGLAFYFVLYFVLYGMLLTCILAGRIRGNAVKASPKLFKELFDIVQEQSKALGMAKVPKVYVMQQGGFINAFATRIMRRHYVVLFAPVLEEAYKEGEDVLRFIVGHELGHIKRNHLAAWKMLVSILSGVFYFLPLAYSRACEYTCDRIGYALSPKGAMKGIALLSVGPTLYRKLDIDAWVKEGDEEWGFCYLAR